MWLPFSDNLERLKTMRFVFKVSFGNFAPYMIANEASLVAVNDELPSPVTMERFRPNVVVTGLGGFQEVS